MLDVFAQYIRQQAALTEAEVEVPRIRSTVRKLRKWQSLLREGEVWRLHCFIASGGCQLYWFSEDGTDHTLRFAVENLARGFFPHRWQLLPAARLQVGQRAYARYHSVNAG